MYLEKRGFALDPDLVLFYHEYNDYLPTYVRDSQNNVIGMTLSDAERYHSRERRLHRGLMQVSAVYRFFSYRLALSKIGNFQYDDSNTRQESISIRIGDREESLKMPVRVRPEERIQILQDLIDECRARNVQLVIIHPAYKASVPHECELTRVCLRNDVQMFEAYPALHPSEATRGIFGDAVHPTAVGHERLADALARFLIDEGLL
jgi:hypothetical protein